MFGSFIASSPQHSYKFKQKNVEEGLDENLYEASETNSRVENLSKPAQEKKQKERKKIKIPR